MRQQLAAKETAAAGLREELQAALLALPEPPAELLGAHRDGAEAEAYNNCLHNCEQVWMYIYPSPCRAGKVAALVGCGAGPRVMHQQQGVCHMRWVELVYVCATAATTVERSISRCWCLVSQVCMPGASLPPSPPNSCNPLQHVHPPSPVHHTHSAPPSAVQQVVASSTKKVRTSEVLQSTLNMYRVQVEDEDTCPLCTRPWAGNDRGGLRRRLGLGCTGSDTKGQ